MPIWLSVACGLEHGNGGWISGVLVAVDDPRLQMVLTAQGFAQKALSRCCIAFSGEKEVDRRTAGVHRPVQVHPFSFHPHVGLVYPPRVVGRLEVPAQAPLQFRSIPLDPSPDGDVIHLEPTLGQKLLDVAVRKREAQIPADRQENDLWFKLAPLEQAANRRVQKEHPTSLSRQACKVATLRYLEPSSLDKEA